jgi:hypothetical protein
MLTREWSTTPGWIRSITCHAHAHIHVYVHVHVHVHVQMWH